MIVIEWDGDDLWNLLNLPNAELYKLYCQFYSGTKQSQRETIRRIANNKRNFYRQGKIQMPERSQPYDPEKEPDRIAERRAKLAHNLAGKALETTVITIPIEHLDYYKKLQEALETEGKLSKMEFTSGEHTGFIKNSDNEIEYTQPLENKRIKFQVEFENEPDWPPVTRVESVKLQKKERQPKSEARKAVILPDLQFPHESPEALQIALKIITDVKPDKVVLLGDLLDLAAFSKYEQRPEFAAQTQEAIIRAHTLLANIRRICPHAEIAVLAGNHDQRLEKSILRNAMHAFGLKRADTPEGWPVLSVPYLCAFDTLDVDYIPGYPANRYWINKNLQVRHGQRVRSSGSTAKLVSDDERCSTIFGHVHRIETHYKTVQTYEGGKTNAAFSIGCLCRIDGGVPSTKSGYDLDGNSVTNYEDWQNGLAVVSYEDGDSPFNVQSIYINTFNQYETYLNGKRYFYEEGK